MDELDKNETASKDPTATEKNLCKPPRKRTKRILNLIQNQLEFYFGDANLRHDRFLRNEIDQNEQGYIDLTKMLKFNKLKSLTTDICMLAKAVENSPILTLNEDRTKLRRHSKLPDQVNTDANTIYVEQLPAYVDHDWLKQVFSTCGAVEYISLPRYKHNNHIKGFAFIEFSNATQAAKACQILNTAVPYKNKSKKRQSIEKNENGKPNGETSKPAKRKRSVSFSGSESDSQQEKCKRKRSDSTTSEHSSSPRVDEISNQSKSKTLMQPLSFKTGKSDKNLLIDKPDKESISSGAKRKHSNTTDERNANEFPKKDNIIDNIIDKKKIKIDDSITHVQDDSISDSVQRSDKNLDEHKDGASQKNNGAKEMKNPDSKKQKRKRNHRKRDSEPNVINCPPLYVISKNEWLNLKKQFKNLKRREMAQLKKTVRILKSEKVRQVEMKERILETIEAKHTKKNDEENIDCKTIQKDACSKDEEEVTVKKANYELPSATVCQMTSSSEELTRKEIRSALSQVCEVSYVDYTDGNSKGYVRFSCKRSRDAAIAACGTSWNFQITKLGEEEERNYFRKVEEDRRKKYEGNDKTKNKKKRRGTEKILTAAEKLSEHIRFDT